MEYLIISCSTCIDTWGNRLNSGFLLLAFFLCETGSIAIIVPLVLLVVLITTVVTGVFICRRRQRYFLIWQPSLCFCFFLHVQKYTVHINNVAFSHLQLFQVLLCHRGKRVQRQPITNGGINVEIGNPSYNMYEVDHDNHADAGSLLKPNFTLDPHKVCVGIFYIHS